MTHGACIYHVVPYSMWRRNFKITTKSGEAAPIDLISGGCYGEVAMLNAIPACTEQKSIPLFWVDVGNDRTRHTENAAVGANLA